MTTATTTNPNEVEVVKQEIQAYVERFPMTVANKDESQSAQSAMTTVRKEKKRREDMFKENILNHSKKAYDAAKATWEAHKRVLVDLLKPFNDWEAQTNANILTFETKERARIRKEQEEENRKYMERMAKAEAKGKEPETVRPPKLVQEAPKTLKAEAGAFTIKEEKELVIFDESQLPGYEHMCNVGRYYKVELNKKILEQDLRAGIKVAGAVLKDKLGSAIRG